MRQKQQMKDVGHHPRTTLPDRSVQIAQKENQENLALIALPKSTRGDPTKIPFQMSLKSLQRVGCTNDRPLNNTPLNMEEEDEGTLIPCLGLPDSLSL